MHALKQCLRCFVCFVTGDGFLSFNSPSLRFQICMWIKPVPKETPQRREGLTMEALGERRCYRSCSMLRLVCTTLHHLVRIAKIKPYASYLENKIGENIRESQNGTPDLPTICVTVTVNVLRAAKSRLLMASKVERSWK